MWKNKLSYDIIISEKIEEHTLLIKVCSDERKECYGQKEVLR